MGEYQRWVKGGKEKKKNKMWKGRRVEGEGEGEGGKVKVEGVN
jgi:hypothetical protein